MGASVVKIVIPITGFPCLFRSVSSVLISGKVLPFQFWQLPDFGIWQFLPPPPLPMHPMPSQFGVSLRGTIRVHPCLACTSAITPRLAYSSEGWF